MGAGAVIGFIIGNVPGLAVVSHVINDIHQAINVIVILS
jgi:hypothetical protein